MKLSNCLKIFLAALLLSQIATASGNREIALTESTINRAGKVTVNELSRDFRYLASTSQWHLFGQILTSVDNGMPFDNVYLFKIDKRDLSVSGGWLVSPKKSNLYASVRNCPAAALTNSESKLVLAVKNKSKDNCIYSDQ